MTGATCLACMGEPVAHTCGCCPTSRDVWLEVRTLQDDLAALRVRLRQTTVALLMLALGMLLLLLLASCASVSEVL